MSRQIVLMRRHISWSILLLIGGLLAVSGAARSDMVVVSATASPGYEREAEDGTLIPQSYVISKGRHFGRRADAVSAEHQFGLVLQALAPALARQEYWPVQDPTQADLLIVVHWGETEVYEDPMADFVAESYGRALSDYQASADAAGNADPGRLNELKRMDSMMSGDVQRTTSMNAELLGFQATITQEEKRYFPSEEERTLKTELAENRYFVVLMAWDYAALRAKEVPRLSWVTRMSVRSPGNRFDESVFAMIERAAPHFGKQRDGLTRARTELVRRKAEVEIGESRVVDDQGTVETAPE